MCVHVFTHPCQRPESLPLCKVSISMFPPPVMCLLKRQCLARKRPKSDQTKCHAPFSARKYVGGDMLNMSCHVTLETDPCVCPCQYSPTHVKDQNPCLCVKCQFQRSRPPIHVVTITSVWLENAPNQTKQSATPPFHPAGM